MDVGKKHKAPESQTRDFIAHAGSFVSVSVTLSHQVPQRRCEGTQVDATQASGFASQIKNPELQTNLPDLCHRVRH